MAREGARVWATDIDAAGLESLPAEAPGIQVATLDVRSDAAWAALVARTGTVDVLIDGRGEAPRSGSPAKALKAVVGRSAKKPAAKKTRKR
jgi:NADP-dependent 3-hydroxy acid dehydrogenase YdfG